MRRAGYAGLISIFLIAAGCGQARSAGTVRSDRAAPLSATAVPPPAPSNGAKTAARAHGAAMAAHARARLEERRSAPASPSVRQEAEANLRAARLLLAAGDARGALLEASLAIGRDPVLAEAWHARGRAELELGLPDEGAEDLENAVILAPNDGPILNDWGSALLLARRPERAVAPLEHAAQTEPELAFVRHNLGIAYDQLGRLEDARATLARAVELSSTEAVIAEPLRPELSPLEPSVAVPASSTATASAAAPSLAPQERLLAPAPAAPAPLPPSTPAIESAADPGKQPADDVAGWDYQESGAATEAPESPAADGEDLRAEGR